MVGLSVCSLDNSIVSSDSECPAASQPHRSTAYCWSGLQSSLGPVGILSYVILSCGAISCLTGYLEVLLASTYSMLIVQVPAPLPPQSLDIVTCSSFVPFAVINTTTKSNLGRKGLISSHNL